MKILLLSLIFVPMLAWGQQTTSRLDRFTGTSAVATMVRGDGAGRSVMCLRTDGSSLGHQFVVQDSAFGPARGLEMGQLSLRGDHLGRIGDMEVVEGICYFCGEYLQRCGESVDLEEHVTEEYCTKGVFGWFALDDVLSGSGEYHLVVVPEAECLLRLEAFEGSGRELAMTGVPAGGNRATMMVRAFLESVPQPVYWTERLTNSDLELTDILHQEGMLAVVMRYSDEQPGDHWRYAVSWNKALPYPNVLDLLHVVAMPHDAGGSYREFASELRLCGLGGDELAVVHPGARNSGHGYSAHRLRMWDDATGNNHLSLLQAQFSEVSGGPFVAEDAAYLPTRRLMPVCLRNPSGGSVMNWTDWGASADHVSHGLSGDSVTMQSLDALDGSRVALVGLGAEGSPMMMVKNANWLASPGLNCLPVVETYGEVFENGSIVNEEIYWESVPYNIDIQNYSFRSIRISRSHICTKFEPISQ